MTKDGLERMPEHVHTTTKQTPPEGQSLKHVARSIRSGRLIGISKACSFWSLLMKRNHFL